MKQWIVVNFVNSPIFQLNHFIFPFQSSDNVEFSSDDEEGYESGRFNNIEIQSQ